MTYDEAMNAAKENGVTVMQPHWHRHGVRFHNGKLWIVDENDTAGNVFRPIKRERDATDWMVRP